MIGRRIIQTGRPLVLLDQFERSDRALDAPKIGPSPVFYSGANDNTNYWAIAGGKIQPSQYKNENRALWNIGATSYVLTVVIYSIGGDNGIDVRGAANANNIIVVHPSSDGGNGIWKRVSGVYTKLADFSKNVSSGETVKIIVTPQKIVASTSGGATATLNDSLFGTNTYVGVRSNNPTPAIYDSISVMAL